MKHMKEEEPDVFDGPFMGVLRLDTPPRFIFAPDAQARLIYIVCTAPLALMLVDVQNDKLFILDGAQDKEMLLACGEWYTTVKKDLDAHYLRK